MEGNKKLDLSAIKNLRDSFNNLKEKVANTMKEKRELLQSKCELGLKKISNFMYINKSTAINTIKVLGLTALILAAGLVQFKVTMNNDMCQVGLNPQMENSIVAEAPEYNLLSNDDIVIIKKDYFEAIDGTKDVIEGLQGVVESINKAQIRGNINSKITERSDFGGDLGDRYECMTALAKKLKQMKKSKEKKNLGKEASLVNSYNSSSSSSNQYVGHAIIEEIEEGPVTLEKRDVNGDGIKDEVYEIDFDGTDYNSIIIDNKSGQNIPESEEYSR